MGAGCLVAGDCVVGDTGMDSFLFIVLLAAIENTPLQVEPPARRR